MQVKSIAECCSILQYFRPSLSYHLSLRSLFCLFMSGRWRHVLLKYNEVRGSYVRLSFMYFYKLYIYEWRRLLHSLCSLTNHPPQSELPWQIPWNSLESDLWCTSTIYFDNVRLTLHTVTLSSQKPCQHNNKCDRSKTNGYTWSLCFFQ